MWRVWKRVVARPARVVIRSRRTRDIVPSNYEGSEIAD